MKKEIGLKINEVNIKLKSRKLKDLETDINKNANRHEKFKRWLNG